MHLLTIITFCVVFRVIIFRICYIKFYYLHEAKFPACFAILAFLTLSYNFRRFNKQYIEITRTSRFENEDWYFHRGKKDYIYIEMYTNYSKWSWHRCLWCSTERFCGLRGNHVLEFVRARVGTYWWNGKSTLTENSLETAMSTRSFWHCSEKEREIETVW